MAQRLVWRGEYRGLDVDVYAYRLVSRAFRGPFEPAQGPDHYVLEVNGHDDHTNYAFGATSPQDDDQAVQLAKEYIDRRLAEG